MRALIVVDPVETIAAAALLIPVDALGPAVGGGALRGIRAALRADGLEPTEITQEIEELEARIPKPWRLARGSAVVVEGIARWRHVLFADCLAHNAADRVLSAAEHGHVLER